MLAFATRYAKIQALLVVLMIAYWFFAVPLVEPPPRAQTSRETFSIPLPTEHWWQAHFPADSWQTNAPDIINTKQGILLCRSWDAIDEKTWRLDKLTMMIPKSRDEAPVQPTSSQSLDPQDMWIISAEQGATIYFDSPPQPDSGKMPTIARGDLTGRIEIKNTWGMKTGSGGHSQVRLTTSDVTINRTQVWTNQPVIIQWDDSIVRGRDMLIRLSRDLLSGGGGNETEWGPLSELELYNVEEVDIGLPPGGIWADMDPSQLTDSVAKRYSAAEFAALPARMRATCGGRFTFDFSRSTATLQNGVRVEHQLGDLPSDSFLCERMMIAMEPPEERSNKVAADASRLRSVQGSPTEVGGIRIKRLEAVGADGLRNFSGEKWVELDAPIANLHSTSKTLNVDLERQRIEFGGRLNQPGSVQSSVTVRYGDHKFQAIRLEYQAPPKVEGQAAAHLGWLVGKGPGELITSGLDSPAGSTAPGSRNVVRWEDSLRMAPDTKQPGLQWVELTGNPFVESDEQGRLSGSRIELWLERDTKSLLTENGEDARAKWRPVRAYSPSQTQIATRDLRADVTELDLTIETRPVVADTPTGDTGAGLALQDSAGNPMYQWVRPPESDDRGKTSQNTGTLAVGKSASEQVTKPSRQPVNVRGKKLIGRIVQQGAETWIDSLNIAGPVFLDRSSEDDSNEPSWSVEGSLLLLATNTEGQADVQIEGAPAVMKVADGEVLSESIRFDQGRNLVTIDHPGEFTAPLSMLAQSASNDAGEIEWRRAPHCKWQGRMLFDGQLLRLEGGVEFDLWIQTNREQDWLTAGTADELLVYLTEPVDMRSEGSGDRRSKAEIDRLVLNRNVNILASQVADNPNRDVVSREQIIVPQLTFYAKEEKVVGIGSGVLLSRFLMEGDENKIGQLAASPSNSGKTLQGAYVTFRDSMVGLLRQKELVLDGKIELLTGPIASWDDSILPNVQQELEQDQMLMNCDQLKVYDTADLSTSRERLLATTGDETRGAMEFKAMGNVAFNGVTPTGEIDGNGYSLTYSQIKNHLTLRGNGRDYAYIRKRPFDPTKQEFEASLQTVTINPDTLETPELEFGENGFRMQQREENGRWQSAGDGTQPSSTGERVPLNQPSLFDPRRSFNERLRNSRGPQ